MNENTSAVVEPAVAVPRIPKAVPAHYRMANGHIRTYSIDPAIAKPLAAIADPACYKCLGTGIKDFRAQGMKARVCKCVLDKQPPAESK